MRPLLGLFALLPGKACADLDRNFDIAEAIIEEDDACNAEGNAEACALQLRALRGETVRGAITTDDTEEGASASVDHDEAIKLFREIDTDDDGEVQVPELVKFLEAHQAKSFVSKAASLVELYDMKGSKGLNMEELDKALDTVFYEEGSGHRQYRPNSHFHHLLLELGGSTREADIAAEKALFAAIDSNHDGAIQKSELEAFLKTSNDKVVMQKAPSLLEVHDMDNSHSLSLAEFGKALDTVSWGYGYGGGGGWHAGGWHAGGGGWGGGGWHGGGWHAGGFHGGGGGWGGGGWHGGGWHAGGFHAGGGGFGGGGWHAGGWHAGGFHHWLMQLNASDSSIVNKTDEEKGSALIALVDANNDGEVQSDEMQAMLDKSGVAVPIKNGATKLITLFDHDQSKGLNLEEFQHALDAADWWAHSPATHFHDSAYHHWLLQVNDTQAAEAINSAEASALFKKVDGDSSSEVDQTELNNFVANLVESTPEQKTALLEVHDVDQSNGLNLQEFSKATDVVQWGYGYGGRRGYGYGHRGGGWGHRRGYGYGHGGSWGGGHGYGYRRGYGWR